ncbi:MAG: hypothetical protein EOP35_16240 [Rubrivivax sp.]|nr:MAG: hypothetical protein EOP35_16240 [Rubrivivax sp.]
MAPAAAEVAARPVAHDARDTRPFAIVDKRRATLSIYAADGHLIGRTAALLGLTPGDAEPASARGKLPSALGATERVTPAGRFEAVPGRNLMRRRWPGPLATPARLPRPESLRAPPQGNPEGRLARKLRSRAGQFPSCAAGYRPLRPPYRVHLEHDT